ncbi:MAG TPA: AAA family ATPase [Acidimicrobiales bacterium]|nr:AAA family ATPase [Acidimicrobiales bacterium]
MFLKSLTLKGFKSFADPASLQLEPGVTVVVGPNGSGKSNVVDAVAWVLGAQGPRTVRSQKMEDVIFAGSSDKAPLGRAEVSLTIDNRAGDLPGGLAEITITRTLFRSGDSEYALNGQPCRLLDIQELLSDSGVGRQQHVIVSQGQLDSILNARPEDRRAVIEEAAGVLKHRRRRERAERRLAAAEENLERLGDLLREVRRQIRPLERQAAAARSYAALSEELRSLRLYLVGRELGSLEDRRRSAGAERALLAEDDTALRSSIAEIDAAAERAASELASKREEDLVVALTRTEALSERCRGLAGVLAERRRSVAMALEVAAGTDVVSTLEADSARLESELTGLQAQEEGLAPLAAEVELAEQDLRSQAADLESGSGELAVLSAAEAELREAERGRHRMEERAEALEQASAQMRAASASTTLAGGAGVVGVLGELVEVDEGFHLAFDAAAGPALGAVVLESDETAREALSRLASAGGSGTVLAVGGLPSGSAGARDAGMSLPRGASWLREHVRPRQPAVAGLLDRLLDGVVFVEGRWDRALEVVRELPDMVVVDTSGDRFARTGWAISAASALDTRAAAEEARRRAAELALAAERAHSSLVAAQRLADASRRRLEESRSQVAAMRRDLEVKAAALAERRSVLSSRLEEAERRLAGHSAERARASERRRRLEEVAAGVDRLDSIVAGCAARISALLERVHERRARHLDEVRAGGARLDTLRHERSEADSRLASTRERLQRLDLELAEIGLRHEAATEALRRELGAELTQALTAACPPLPEGVDARSRAASLESELAAIGPVNPLALEELGNLEERHRFLDEQVDDVRRARRELHQVISAVDDEIVRLFAEAFADVNEHFQVLMATLFPGSTGRLVLTEPSGLLDTGVDVEARPAGKNVRKLSLLSGGERSLVALAFLFAVFRSRPSPFYLLDEVEAALDDVNLHRFLDLLHEFRGEAQLIIVSHQKRTMEAADALYGVTMTPGGSSKVVSQKVSRQVPDDESASLRA